MASERINIAPGTRRVGYAHRWAQPLPFSTAVIVTLLVNGCTSSTPEHPFWDQPIGMPRESEVKEIGFAMGEPLTARIRPNSHVGGPIIMDLKITNVTDHEESYWTFSYIEPSQSFSVWLLHDGQQVPLTKYGQAVQPRHTLSLIEADGPTDALKPGATKAMQIDLKKIFDIAKPGEYTAIIVEGPIPDFQRSEPAKTSFTLLP